MLANGPLLPTGRVKDGGWLTLFACRIVVRTLRQSAGRYTSNTIC